jgi:fused signal recognition particle receptor
MAKEHFPFLKRARVVFDEIKDMLQHNKTVSPSLWNDLTEKLVTADISPQTSRWIIQCIQQQAVKGQIRSGTQVYEALRQLLTHLLEKSSSHHSSEQLTPTIMMVLSDDKPGTTTTLAKLAFYLNQKGRRVFVITTNTPQTHDGDPLSPWIEQTNIPIMYQNDSSNPCIFIDDLLKSALVQGYDMVLIETLGYSLTEKFYLKKVISVFERIQKVIPHAPHELFLVIDATRIQETLPFIHVVLAATGLTGVILSKTAMSIRGGMVFTIVDDLGVPIKFLDPGEKEQLLLFDPEKFIAELFENP